MTYITVTTKQAKLKFEVLDNQKVALIQVNSNDLSALTEQQKQQLTITEVQVTGENFHHKGLNFVNTTPGVNLVYQSYQVDELASGKLLKITTQAKKQQLVVENYYQLFDETAIIKSWVAIHNMGNDNVGIEYVSSFAMTGINQGNDIEGNFAINNLLYKPHNNWQAEAQWQQQTLKEAGLDYWTDIVDDQQNSTKRISVTNNSSWSASEFSPNGILTNTVTNQSAIWQIENNGAWHYEFTDSGNGELLTLLLSGPEELDNHWWKNLQPGESFETVKVAFGQVMGDYEKAIEEMTKYRRLIRRTNYDNQKLPVIFNDYMNGLMGDPTEEKERPLIDAAAEIGCDYFVIDCGWYADGYWWDSVGEWLPSDERFPNGITTVIQYIRDKGLVPGLWLEIEVVGINSPLANKLPDDWFFMRHGKRIIDCDRYHLDFRNPEVRQFADKVIKRLVEDYGVGYIKMDYNITTGIGTETNADSVGDGLLNHNRAYLQWLDDVFTRYPDLVIENCGSGGMRHDYAMLQRHSIQSMTDQKDYVRNGNIAAVGSSVVTPEQCAIWSYPLQKGDKEEVIFNMVNAMLVRIHQSGLLNQIDQERLDLVAEGIQVYKAYREKIPMMVPVWPEMLSHLDDEWYSFGLKGDHELYLAVWHGIGDVTSHQLSLAKYGDIQKVTQIYPSVDEDDNSQCQFKDGQLSVNFNHEKMARLYHVTFN
ncbi:glycoside hydrolase family 36 protein [Weissella thailandensis]|uniref:Alpha-galactosidase n=1 Tax=Weissella thailandensis TaxID=89061 RepID=A0ABX9I9J5_9LACO|nr:glycoside hydrolase family 36 protein [Weissella thailandensis]NKY90620.1 alpha-galactosidase [Weissella thailandensis]RDS59981.1 alpha-galactosidase [Weissella thailandensis]GEP73932.1 alpha-galactosidase [Weissella thailandensis]